MPACVRNHYATTANVHEREGILLIPTLRHRHRQLTDACRSPVVDGFEATSFVDATDRGDQGEQLWGTRCYTLF